MGRGIFSMNYIQSVLNNVYLPAHLMDGAIDYV